MKKVTNIAKNRFELLKEFQNKWVAFNKDYSRILASGNSSQEIDKKMRKVREKASVIEYVIPFDQTISPCRF